MRTIEAVLVIELHKPPGVRWTSENTGHVESWQDEAM